MSEIDDDRERRDAHLEAVHAQCTVAPEYALALLTWHEAELTDLLELALELDDQAPAPDDGDGTWRTVAE